MNIQPGNTITIRSSGLIVTGMVISALLNERDEEWQVLGRMCFTFREEGGGSSSGCG